MMMKIINKIVLAAIMIALCGCPKADKEFVHESNVISGMVCRGEVGGTEISGEIHEYDKNGVMMTGEFTQEDVEGGYGVIIFYIPNASRTQIDIENVLLMARLTWDQIITPSLIGRHNISGEGIIITINSGAGTQRSYRVRGEYF